MHRLCTAVRPRPTRRRLAFQASWLTSVIHGGTVESPLLADTQVTSIRTHPADYSLRQKETVLRKWKALAQGYTCGKRAPDTNLLMCVPGEVGEPVRNDLRRVFMHGAHALGAPRTTAQIRSYVLGSHTVLEGLFRDKTVILNFPGSLES